MSNCYFIYLDKITNRPSIDNNAGGKSITLLIGNRCDNMRTVVKVYRVTSVQIIKALCDDKFMDNFVFLCLNNRIFLAVTGILYSWTEFCTGLFRMLVFIF